MATLRAAAGLVTLKEAAQAMGTGLLLTVRIVLYPFLLLLRVVARLLLFLAVAAPIALPVTVLGAFYTRSLVPELWSLVSELLSLVSELWSLVPEALRLALDELRRVLADSFVRRSTLTQAVAFLVGAGVFAGILKMMSGYAWNQTLSLLRTVGDVLRDGWNPGLVVRKGLAGTWHDNIARIPGDTKQSLQSAGRLTAALTAGVLLAVVAYPLFERPVQTVDRYVAVVDARDIAAETKQQIKLYLRSGAVFSLAHVQDADPKTGRGICLGGPQQDWLREFSAAIQNCLEDGKDAIGTVPVFKVTGYASIAPMHMSGDTSASPKLNCKVANWRAQAVGAFLANGDAEQHAKWWRCEDVAENFNSLPNECDSTESRCEGCTASPDAGFRVDVHRWSTPDEMVQGKPADDGSMPDRRRFEVEILNRVVHIAVPEGFCRTAAAFQM